MVEKKMDNGHFYHFVLHQNVDSPSIEFDTQFIENQYIMDSGPHFHGDDIPSQE
jgi:hypothetical protein